MAKRKGPLRNRKFKVTASRLRELGLLRASERAASIKEGPWTMSGMYYISVVRVELDNGATKEFVLKCPWDFTTEWLDNQFVTAKGRDWITSFVNLQVKLSKEFRRIGVNAVRAEKYDKGTIIQENIGGHDFEATIRSLPPAKADELENKRREALHKIEAQLHLVPVNRSYVTGHRIDVASDFLVDEAGNPIVINFDFAGKNHHP